jgi:hypothetical protein
LGKRMLAGILQVPGMWIAYGGEHVVENNWPDNHPQAPIGFVALSYDQGGHWKIIDEWKQAGVGSLWWMPNGDMYLASRLGSIRKLTKITDGYKAENIHLASNIDKSIGPIKAVDESLSPVSYQPCALYFEDESNGYLTGLTEGWVCYQTRDGGRTWEETDFSKFPFLDVIRVGDQVVGLKTYRDFDTCSEVCLVRGGKFKKIFGGKMTRENPIGVGGISAVDDHQVLIQYFRADIDTEAQEFSQDGPDRLKIVDISKASQSNIWVK